MEKENIKKASLEELKNEVLSCKQEYFNQRIASSTMQVKDNSQFKKLRARVARALTEIRARE